MGAFTRMSVIQGMKAARNPTARTLSRMRSQIILAGSFASSRMSMLPSNIVETFSRRARALPVRVVCGSSRRDDVGTDRTYDGNDLVRHLPRDRFALLLWNIVDEEDVRVLLVER